MWWSSHIEGRIAFLKTELKITDAQLPQWNAFADALRSSMTALHAAMQSMMQANGRATAPDQMERQVAVLSSHLDSAKAGLAAVKPLYAALSDEQKKTAGLRRCRSSEHCPWRDRVNAVPDKSPETTKHRDGSGAMQAHRWMSRHGLWCKPPERKAMLAS